MSEDNVLKGSNNRHDNIILIGFMGSGKTTFGRWISRNKGYGLCDTDEYIEKKQGRKIKDIFASDGESAFRDMETQTVRDLCTILTHTVISVGGGLPVREENRKLLHGLGTVVYLRTSKDELARRLYSDKDRPLLAGGSLEEKIESLMAAREEIYIGVSDVIVDTDKMTFEEMFQVIAGGKAE